MASNGNWFNNLSAIVLAVLAVYLVLGALMFFFQSRLLYLPGVPSRAHFATPQEIGLAYEPVTLSTKDGQSLSAWFIPAEEPRGTLLFFHGNAGNISHRLQSIAVFSALRLSVLIIDYRGYGKSTGEPSEEGTYEDARAAWHYLTTTRGIPAHRIVLFGRSLGAAVAVHLAGRVDPAALILESAFTSAPDLAAHHYWFFPTRWLTRFRYDNRTAIAAVDSPVLVIHSRNDEIVPFFHGQALFEAARGPKRLVELRGGHNDGFVVSARTYYDALDAFLSAHLDP